MSGTVAAGGELGAFGFEASERGPLRVVPIQRIRPNRRQPRRSFDPERLQLLAESIDTCGLLSPPLGRELAADRYELVAGERRWRACQLLGWTTLPLLVVNALGDADALAAAVAENVAREGLNPVDEAHALSALLEEFGLTQEQLGERVGRSQEAISHSIRLLNLPDQVLVLLERSELTKAHGKVLLSEPDHQQRIALARRAVAARWSVRRLQAAIATGPAPVAPPQAGLPADMLDAADRWTEALRTRTGHSMTVRATSRGFQIDCDQNAVRALLTHLGVAAEDLDE